MPDWYTLLRAARYLGVAPWDLVRQSSMWTVWANVAESAEIQAQNAHQKGVESRRG